MWMSEWADQTKQFQTVSLFHKQLSFSFIWQFQLQKKEKQRKHVVVPYSSHECSDWSSSWTDPETWWVFMREARRIIWVIHLTLQPRRPQLETTQKTRGFTQWCLDVDGGQTSKQHWTVASCLPCRPYPRIGPAVTYYVAVFSTNYLNQQGSRIHGIG